VVWQHELHSCVAGKRRSAGSREREDWNFGFHRPQNLLINLSDYMDVFILGLFSGAFNNSGYIILNDGATVTQWTGNGLDVGGHGLMCDQISYFVWGDSWKTRHISVRTAGYRTEIWKQDYPNTKQECHPFEIPRPSRNPTVHHRVHKSLPLVPVLFQTNPFHTDIARVYDFDVIISRKPILGWRKERTL
jgi:hypothetical protein